MSRRWTPYLLGLGTIALWGASFPLTKYTLDWMGPMAIAFVRWLISALALGAWLVMQRKLCITAQILRRHPLSLAWIAIAGITLFYALENLALRYTSAINAGILSNLISVFIALLGALWLHERLSVRGWLAMGTAFVGAALVSQGSGHLVITEGGLRGDLMMCAATLLAALYSIGGKGLTERYPADVVTTLIAALGALFLLPLALAEGFTLAIPSAAWAALIALGLGAGALANLWWLQLLGQTEATRAGMALFLIPVVSTVLAVAALHEPFTPAMLGGGTLVLGSVAVMQREQTHDRVQRS